MPLLLVERRAFRLAKTGRSLKALNLSLTSPITSLIPAILG